MKKVKIINIEKDQVEILKLNPRYMVNKEKLTAIEVPVRIQKTIIKIWKIRNWNSHAFLNSLGQAIELRKYQDIHNRVEDWNTIDYHYAPCRTNTAFDKYISSIAPILNLNGKNLTSKEIDNLIKFFCKCPHGYDVSSIIRPLSEFYPIVT